MNFLDLPVEAGVTIFNYLDTPTKFDVYNSCTEVRDYFGSGWCHLKNVILARSTLATVKTLDQKLFVNLGEHIRDLNLSGIKDLTVENLKPHMKRFLNLKSLDLTFTNIYLSDIAEVCPQSVTNIGINFFKSPSSFINETIKTKCREIFIKQHFEVVHFVVFEVVVSASPLLFLNDVPLVKDLKLTISDNYKDFFDLDHQGTSVSDPNEIETNFNKLSYKYRDCAVSHKMSKQLDIVSKLNFDQIEYIFIMCLKKIVIYVSPIFLSIFTVNCKDLKVEVSPVLPKNFMIDGNIIFLAWNKESTNFDDAFFNNLLLDLKDYFPTYVCMQNKTKMKIIEAPSSWYCVDGCESFDKDLSDIPEKLTLTDYCRRDGCRIMRCEQPISFRQGSKMIQLLTFLRIHNVPLEPDFFTSLFYGCPKLVTLDIYTENLILMRDYTQSLSNSIYLSKLKNFMVTSENVQYQIFFEILSRCPSLENIHICEYNKTFERVNHDEDVNIDNIVLIENCVHLYSLFIEAFMVRNVLTMLIERLKVTAKRLGRDHLSINMCELYCGWNPVADVFNPSPLDILY